MYLALETMTKKKQLNKNRHKYFYFFLLFSVVISLLFGREGYAGEANLSWIPPTTNEDGTPLTDLAGYKVYYGTNSHNYSQSIDVGNTTTYTVTNLTEGFTYYFAVTAYDISFHMSNYSNEVMKTILTHYMITVNKIGTGSGIVTSASGGINCGTDCSESYDTETAVTLTALPNAESVFAGWSGGGCTGAGICVGNVNSDITVTATFTQTYLLRLIKTGSGSGTVTSSPGGINCASDCEQSYNSGTSVTLTALPDTGSTFGGWSGGGCTGTGSCTVTMDATKNVTAAFITVHSITPPPPSVTLSTPNGGETWAAGTTHAITWTYTGSPGTYVKIELYKNGALNRTISSYASIGSGGTGSYNWPIPSNEAGGSDYKIKITSVTNSSYNDMSNNNFTITGPPPPSITASAPNGGETWAAGTTHAITWTYTGSPGTYVKIELYKNGALNRTISSYASIGSGGTGSYNWPIPSNEAGGSDYKIKITSVTNSSYNDMSNNNFTITGPPPPSITASAPNGGETWAAGTTHAITWTYTGSPGTYVKIELYKNGALNRTISSYASIGSGGTGSYNWPIPSNEAGGSDYKIKITSVTNSSYNDMSNNNFTITGPPPPSITRKCT